MAMPTNKRLDQKANNLHGVTGMQTVGYYTKWADPVHTNGFEWHPHCRDVSQLTSAATTAAAADHDAFSRGSR